MNYLFWGRCSVAKSRPALCNPMDCSTPGFPVLHCLSESAPTRVHWVGDAIQPSHPLSSPSPPALSLSQRQGPFDCCDLNIGRCLGVASSLYKNLLSGAKEGTELGQPCLEKAIWTLLEYKTAPFCPQDPGAAHRAAGACPEITEDFGSNWPIVWPLRPSPGKPLGSV